MDPTIVYRVPAGIWLVASECIRASRLQEVNAISAHRALPAQALANKQPLDVNAQVPLSFPLCLYSLYKPFMFICCNDPVCRRFTPDTGCSLKLSSEL